MDLRAVHHPSVLLLLDIGNTHTHIALARGTRVFRPANLPTHLWRSRRLISSLQRFVGRETITAVALCSVVPAATREAVRQIRSRWGIRPFLLTHQTLAGLGIDYSTPATIGPGPGPHGTIARCDG